MVARFQLSDSALDPVEQFRELSNPSAGGFVSFEGRVRAGSGRGPVSRVDYEAYPALCERIGRSIVERAVADFDLLGAVVAHRTGCLPVGTSAIWIGVSGRHRKECFAACAWILEAVKSELPIWKREVLEDGSSEWIHDRLARAETSANHH
jgi:molybdopterin synthase catalytic subunit